MPVSSGFASRFDQATALQAQVIDGAKMCGKGSHTYVDLAKTTWYRLGSRAQLLDMTVH
jgi:hypothetical protein